MNILDAIDNFNNLMNWVRDKWILIIMITAALVALIRWIIRRR